MSGDAISNLPDSIVDSILGRLPLCEAVRTSILSKEWRYKWTSIPNVEFDFLYNYTYLQYIQCENIVHQALLHHKGPINKFSLSCRIVPDLVKYILLLPSSHVHDFTLHLTIKIFISSHLFTFQNLKHLNLHRCIFYPPPPPHFKGFSKLITLDFEDVDYQPVIFQEFISQSPLLERVRLVDCTDFASFEVQGPSLRFFTLCGIVKTICFKKSPLLVDVSLSVPRGGVPTRCFTDSIKSLKVLSLLMFLKSTEEVACAFRLARSSPNLQKLRITLDAYRIEEAVIEYIRSQEIHYLKQLRRVEIASFSGSEPEIELLKYLLASAVGLEEMVITYKPQQAVVLEEMVITFTPHLSDHDLRLMHDRLKQLPRASPTALLLFI